MGGGGGGGDGVHILPLLRKEKLSKIFFVWGGGGISMAIEQGIIADDMAFAVLLSRLKRFLEIFRGS